MDTVSRLQEISLRLDHLDSMGELLNNSLAGTDPSLAQTAALISTLAEDIRLRLLETVKELESQLVQAQAQLGERASVYH